MKDINLIQVNTTAYNEEDFVLITTLDQSQIESVIEPIVLKERNTDLAENYYNNDTLYNALIKEYPNDLIQYYDLDTIEKITI